MEWGINYIRVFLAVIYLTEMSLLLVVRQFLGLRNGVRFWVLSNGVFATAYLSLIAGSNYDINLYTPPISLLFILGFAMTLVGLKIFNHSKIKWY